VASLLAAAEQAASQVLREANDESEAIRADARGEAARVRDQAVSALRDAQRQRADIEKLVHDVRGAADAYAEQRRREADDEAARTHDRLRELGSMAREFADEIDQSLARREPTADTAEESFDEALTPSAAKAPP
jgi:hypothetical protein